MPEQETKNDSTLEKIVAKVKDAENVLVALSDNPTVDEMAAAIGLTMALDSAEKHATAIYSGETPNVLEFLNPQETFETNTNSLQDFIIALNKEKADHLRYKVDGDFVKVYITPYRTTISEDDLEFSRGDFNVDLVIALNVAAATDLDGALKEHGRIMHDASAVNITMGPPGKFGEVEWIDEKASSISEMVTNLALKLKKDLDKGTATALLTGLVAATDRFSNEKTTPEAMVLAAKLMGAGADQQVIAANIAGKIDLGEKAGATSEKAKEKEEDKSRISIDHNAKTEEDEEVEEDKVEEALEEPQGIPENTEELTAGAIPQSPAIQGVTDGAGAAVTPAGEPAMTMPQTENFTGINTVVAPEPSLADQMVQQMTNAGTAGMNPATMMANQMMGATESSSEGTTSEAIPAGMEAKDYGKMIDEALAEPLPGEGGVQVGAIGANGAVTYNEPIGNSAEGGSSYLVSQPEKVLNPANAQPVPNIEELVRKELAEPVPVPNDLPMPGQEILPPPPTPPVDFSMDGAQPESVPVPEMPQVQMEVPEMGAPEMSQTQQASNDNNSFQIPGMG